MTPSELLVVVLSETCVPVAGRCMERLASSKKIQPNEALIEFELCIGIFFKPLRHHLQRLVTCDTNIYLLWKPILHILEEFLVAKDDVNATGIAELKSTMDSLAAEHFQSVVLVLISSGIVLEGSKSKPWVGELTKKTFETARSLGVSEKALASWKQAMAASSHNN